MAALNLNIAILDTHDLTTIIVADTSTYPDQPPIVSSPILLVTPPGFLPTSVPFNVQGYVTLTTAVLGITPAGTEDPLPDGLYTFSYSIAPSASNFVDITIMKVDRLQEKFDDAFMSLDFMVCDQAIKTQAKVNLNAIYLLIQGAIAAGNKCALIEANKLYDKASQMLDTMIKKDCGCTGNNFIINFN